MLRENRGLSCSWNDYTKPCDDVFFDAADACAPEVGTVTSSAFVVSLAQALALLDRSGGCVPGTQCPGPAEAGFGPCAKNRAGPECAACLGKNDPGSACFSQACFDPGPNPDICYTANCPGTDECFGWGKTGTGGVGGGGSGGKAGAGGASGSSGKSGGSGTGGSGAAGSGGTTSTCKDSADVGATLALAKKLPSESDCDGSSQVSGIIDGKNGDADFYTYYGSDTFGCQVDPVATVTAPGLKFCMWSECAYKYSCGSNTASPIGTAEGCCATTPATLSVATDCNGSDDSTTIYMKVFVDPGSIVCAAYNIQYHY